MTRKKLRELLPRAGQLRKELRAKERLAERLRREIDGLEGVLADLEGVVIHRGVPIRSLDRDTFEDAARSWPTAWVVERDGLRDVVGYRGPEGPREVVCRGVARKEAVALARDYAAGRRARKEALACS